LTGDDDVIVVDNASNLPELTRALQSIADREPRVHLVLRATNDTSPRNRKVGELAEAVMERHSARLSLRNARKPNPPLSLGL
jgi:hypothetical protein